MMGRRDILMLLLAAGVAPLPVAAQSALLKLAWVRDFRLDDAEVELRAVAQGKGRDDPIWLVVGKRQRGRLGGIPDLVLWKLGANGDLEREVGLLAVPGLIKRRLAANTALGLDVLPGGDLRLVLSEVDNSTSVAILDSSAGAVRSIVRMTGSERQPMEMIRATVNPAQPAQLQLVGRRGGGGWLALVDRTPAPREWAVSQDGVEVLVDVAFSGSHRYLAGLGIRGSSVSQATIFHQRDDGPLGDGAIKMPARSIQMAAAPVGGNLVGLIYDRPGEKGWSIGLNAYDSELRPLWNKVLFSEVRLFSAFQLSIIGLDQLLVLGGDAKSALWGRLYDRHGAEIWSLSTAYDWPVNDVATNYFITPSSNGAMISSTVLSVRQNADGRYEQRQLVRMMRLVSG